MSQKQERPNWEEEIQLVRVDRGKKFIEVVDGKIDLESYEGREQARQIFYNDMEIIKLTKEAISQRIGEYVYNYDQLGLWKDEYSTSDEWIRTDKNLPFRRAWIRALKANHETYFVKLGWSREDMIWIGATKLRTARSHITAENQEELKEDMEVLTARDLELKLRDPRRLSPGDYDPETVTLSPFERLQEGWYALQRVSPDRINHDQIFVSEQLNEDCLIYRDLNGTALLRKGHTHDE